MAQEITLAASLIVTKNGLAVPFNVSAVLDMAGSDVGLSTQVIGTASEQLIFPADIASMGQLLIVNLDPTNYVQLSYTSGGGFASFSTLIAVPAGGVFGGVYLGRPESLTIYAKANAAACRVAFLILPL